MVAISTRKFVATALTVYGIETMCSFRIELLLCGVATALTVYGIETDRVYTFVRASGCNSTYRLRY